MKAIVVVDGQISSKMREQKTEMRFAYLQFPVDGVAEEGKRKEEK